MTSGSCCFSASQMPITPSRKFVNTMTRPQAPPPSPPAPAPCRGGSSGGRHGRHPRGCARAGAAVQHLAMLHALARGCRQAGKPSCRPGRTAHLKVVPQRLYQRCQLGAGTAVAHHSLQGLPELQRGGQAGRWTGCWRTQPSNTQVAAWPMLGAGGDKTADSSCTPARREAS